MKIAELQKLIIQSENKEGYVATKEKQFLSDLHKPENEELTPNEVFSFFKILNTEAQLFKDISKAFVGRQLSLDYIFALNSNAEDALALIQFFNDLVMGCYLNNTGTTADNLKKSSLILLMKKHDVFSQTFFECLINHPSDLKEIEAMIESLARLDVLREAQPLLLRINFLPHIIVINFLDSEKLLTKPNFKRLCEILDLLGDKCNHPIFDILFKLSYGEIKLTQKQFDQITSLPENQAAHLAQLDYFYLENILSLSPDNLSAISAQIDKNPDSHVLAACFELSSKSLSTNEQLKRVLQLSEAHASRLAHFVESLPPSDDLPADLIATVLERIQQALPLSSPTVITKKSRKKTNALRSEIMYSESQSLFLQHDPKKDYLAGAFGIVKKGFASNEAVAPIYAIKKLKQPLTKAILEAKREVKFHQLLGRNAFYYVNNNKVAIVMDWLKEKTLFEFSEEELTSIPQIKRLACLISLLTEINTLHKRLYLHGDIKPSNLILNPVSQTLNIIDFGTSHKSDSLKIFGFTPDYLEPSKKRSNKLCDDMYTLSFTIKKLFPELDVTDEESKDEVNSKEPLNILMQAMDRLLKALKTSSEKRCTSEEALQYCQRVIDATQGQNLDKEQLSKIENETIANPTIPLESIIRGRVIS